MIRAVKLNLDNTWEQIELQDFPHLQKLVEGYVDVSFVNSPALHPNHILVGLAYNEEGIPRGLEVNHLASGFMGVFGLLQVPFVGTCVVIAGDADRESIDVPPWAITLVSVVSVSLQEAFRYNQNPEFN